MCHVRALLSDRVVTCTAVAASQFHRLFPCTPCCLAVHEVCSPEDESSASGELTGAEWFWGAPVAPTTSESHVSVTATDIATHHDVAPRNDFASKLDTDSFDLDEAVADACREFLLPSDAQDSGGRLAGGHKSSADGDVETDDDEDAVERMLAQMMGAEE